MSSTLRRMKTKNVFLKYLSRFATRVENLLQVQSNEDDFFLVIKDIPKTSNLVGIV